MAEHLIRVLKVEPGMYPYVSYLDSTMTELRKAVSVGAYEYGEVTAKKIGREIYIIHNSDGFFAGLCANRQVNNDIISGIFYVIGIDKHYHPRSLTDKEVQKYMSRLWMPEKFDDTEVIESEMNVMFKALEQYE